MAGKLKVTSPYRLGADENTARQNNNVKGKGQPQYMTTYPTKPTQGDDTSDPTAGIPNEVPHYLNEKEQDKYLNSGELAFPADEAMYNYLKSDEGSDEQGDIDKGFDEMAVSGTDEPTYKNESPRYRVDYTGKRFGK